MYVRLCVLLPALLCAGCGTTTDVSHREPFRDYVGKTVTLREPMLLINHSGYYFGGANDIMSYRRVRYGLAPPGVYKAPHVFATLPAGHDLTIDSVQEESCFDAYQSVVYGRTIFPPTGKEVTFGFALAPIMYLPPDPLPWN